MIKKFVVLSIPLLIAVVIKAASNYNAQLANEPALAYSKNYTLNLTNTPVPGGISFVAAQAVYSTATLSSVGFNDGQVSTGSITVLNNAGLTSNAATNQITLAATSVLLAAGATNFITVLSTSNLTNAVISYNGNAVRQGFEWTGVSTTSGTAAVISTAMNRYFGLTASRTGSTVNLTCPTGTIGNGRTLSVNVSSLTVGGATFSGGYESRVANLAVVVNGQRLRQGAVWPAATTSSGTATNLAAVINLVSGVRANAVGSVIYATATTAGAAGNAITMTSNAQAYATVANPTFSGGRDNAYLSINGTKLTWTAQSTVAGTAKAISDAIVASPSLNTLVVSTWTSLGVVYATSTAVGSSKNFVLATNAPTLLSLGTAMTGGSNSAYAANSSVITATNHGLQTGIGVVYSTGSAFGLSPLIPGTTYYVGRIDANNFALASSKTNAVAGTYLTLTSSSIAGPHTFTLAPQTFTGTPTLVWYTSNDGTNFNTVSTSSVTYSSPSGISSTSWDLGRVNAKYLQLQVGGPTTGGMNLVVTVSGSQ